MMSAAVWSSRMRTPWRSALTSGRSMAGLRISPSSPPVQVTSTDRTPLVLYSATVGAPLEASSSGWACSESRQRSAMDESYRPRSRAAPHGAGGCVTSASMGPDQHPRDHARRGPATIGVTRHRTSAATVALALVVVGIILGGCGTSGRTLRDPVPGATAPPRKTSSTPSTAVLQAVPQGLSIASSAWTAGGEIPLGYTCDGQNVSPPLSITGAPEGTVEL